MTKLQKQLDAEFVHGKIPMLDDLFGGPDVHVAEWQVVMLTGFLPNMGGPLLRHRKQFMRTTDRSVVGCNLFRDDYRWGWFKLDPAIGGLFFGSLLIDYDVPENGVLRGHIQDFVRTTLDPNVLIGRFYLKPWSTFRYVGFFKLIRLSPGKV
jgi:hypothetical protein